MQPCSRLSSFAVTAAIFLFTLVFVTLASAQTVTHAPETVSSALANITLGQGEIRFASPQPNAQLRLQIHSAFGELLFDSGVGVDGAALYWNLRDNNEQALVGGLYRYTLLLQTAPDQLPQQQTGALIIEQNSNRLWLTTDEATPLAVGLVGGETNVLRTTERTIAGTTTANRTINHSRINSGRKVNNRDVIDEKSNRIFDSKAQTEKLIAALLGTPGVIAKFGASGNADTNSILTESGATVTAAGNLNVIGRYQINSNDVLRLGGTNNLFVGPQAGAITTGTSNLFIGAQAGLNNTSGASNVFVGAAAGAQNTSGVANVFLGPSSGPSNTTANNNIFIGSAAGYFTTAGGDNVFIGAAAGRENTIGGRNSFIGQSAGGGNSSGSANTYIGDTARGTATIINATAIGANAYVTQSNSLILGAISGQNGATASTNVGIGTTAPQSLLHVNGQARVNVLQITGGADLSENFDVRSVKQLSTKKTNQPLMQADAVQPGMVVTIDPQQAGKLMLSSQAYDRRVVGVISGAGGIRPGMVLSQEGTLAMGRYPVAISGRVYCLVDASKGAIKPGDFLTTSTRPGYAQKASSHHKAQGAILGKAMTELKSGQGVVLVLVTLQ